MEHCNADRDLNLALVCSLIIIFLIGNAVAKRNRPVMRSISSNGPGQTVHPDKMLQCAASDHRLHYFSKLYSFFNCCIWEAVPLILVFI